MCVLCKYYLLSRLVYYFEEANRNTLLGSNLKIKLESF